MANGEVAQIYSKPGHKSNYKCVMWFEYRWTGVSWIITLLSGKGLGNEIKHELILQRVITMNYVIHGQTLIAWRLCLAVLHFQVCSPDGGKVWFLLLHSSARPQSANTSSRPENDSNFAVATRQPSRGKYHFLMMKSKSYEVTETFSTFNFPPFSLNLNKEVISTNTKRSQLN